MIGNRAVHPGKIDLNDNTEIASKLLGIVNIIVATMISANKQIEEMFEGSPPEAKEAIEERDQKALAPNPGERAGRIAPSVRQPSTEIRSHESPSSPI